MVKSFFKSGLTSQEAQARLEKFGKNELVKRREFSKIKLFLSQFKSPLIYILVFAGVITLFLREFTDSVVISGAVLLNVFLGFWQEQKAQKSLAALRSLLAPKAIVIRDEKQKEIKATEVVPGDLVVLTIGVRVPADGALIEATDLSVNEAILTGESMPVKKLKAQSSIPEESRAASKLKAGVENLQFEKIREEHQVFMGTTVVTGISRMVVTKTGMETKMGKIGKRVIGVEEEVTPLQEQLGQLAKILAMVVGAITLGLFVFGGFLGYEPLEMFTTSVAVAVAAIPEGLVITLTVILALGMQRILKRRAVVRQLLAAETLGSVSVICCDKTGTLTEGKMKVVESVTEVQTELHLSGKKPFAPREEMLSKAAILCNDMRDPLEVAMWEWAENKLKVKSEKLKVEDLQKHYPRLAEIPFSPQSKYIATLHMKPAEQDEERILFLSGAPEVVLESAKFKVQSTKREWLRRLEDYGKEGYRLVGFAYKTIENGRLKIDNSDLKNLTWLGILVFQDPIREGVKEALEECQRAGIKVKVVTGDYLPTALTVVKKLALDGRGHAINGDELEKLTQAQLAKIIDEIVLFARTDPEQKLKIVRALKDNGEVVAMTGDGVNDAPALKTADIGIVVGEASDVAKETADMVLLDSNFATIVAAVEEGRVIFENIRKVVLYLLSDSFTEIVLIGGSLLLGWPLPLTAAQILWVNLIEDSLPGMALAFESKEKELMVEPPRPREAPILDLPLKTMIFIIGLVTNFILLVIFWQLRKGFFPLEFIRSVMFVALGINSVFYIFACRSLRKPIFKYNPFSNWFLTATVLLGFFLLASAVYFPPFRLLLKTHPLGLTEWLFLFGLGLFNLFIIEINKWAFIFARRKEDFLKRGTP